MKRILIALIVALLFTSCSKSNNKPEADYFVFGYEGAVCAYCNSIHPRNMAFLVKHNDVYQLKDSLTGPGPIGNFVNEANFSTTAMGDGPYATANALVANFPDFLLDSTDSLYGLPGTYPGCLILAFKNRQWRISMDTATIPVQIRAYIGQVLSTIDTLYPPFGAMAHS